MNSESSNGGGVYIIQGAEFVFGVALSIFKYETIEIKIDISK